MEGRVQVYLPDLKYALPEPARSVFRCGGLPGLTANAAILEMFRQTGPRTRMEDGQLRSRAFCIRHLVLPGELENTQAGHRLGGGDLPPRRQCSFPS